LDKALLIGMILDIMGIRMANKHPSPIAEPGRKYESGSVENA